jgi:hypothetical protein
VAAGKESRFPIKEWLLFPDNLNARGIHNPTHASVRRALETMPMREDNAAREIPPVRRREAVAAILAAGVLRYRRMARKTASSPAQESADSGQNPLGPATVSRPCVPAGSGGYDAREPEKGHGA